MNPDPNPNRDNPNYLLDTMILVGYNVRIECTGKDYTRCIYSTSHACTVLVCHARARRTSTCIIHDFDCTCTLIRHILKKNEQ